MSLYNAFDKTKHFAELNDPLLGGASGTLTSAQRKAAALSNLGVAPAAGQALITGVTAGTAAPSKVLSTDANGGVGGAYRDTRVTPLYAQAAPAAVNTTATLTNAQLAGGIITSTTAAAVVGTLPTGTLMETNLIAAYPGLQNNDSFDFSVVNTGPNSFTIATATGWTDGGNAFTAVATATSALFRARRTAANTYTLYRIG